MKFEFIYEESRQLPFTRQSTTTSIVIAAQRDTDGLYLCMIKQSKRHNKCRSSLINICHTLAKYEAKIQLKFKTPNKKRAKINLSALSYDTIRRCYFLFGLSIFFISLKLVFNSFFKSGIFFSCGKCSGPFPVLSITMFLTSRPTL